MHVVLKIHTVYVGLKIHTVLVVPVLVQIDSMRTVQP